MANLVAGAIVLATLIFLAPLFESLPEPILAAVVIVAVLPSADPRRIVRLWHINRLDFAAATTTFGLVLVWETLPAMAVGVVLSLGFVVRRASFPDVIELRQDGDGRYTVAGATTPETVGAAILRFEGPLVYASSDRLLKGASALADRHPDVGRMVLDCEMVSDLDASGADALARLDESLAGRDIELHLGRVHVRARDQMQRSGLHERFTGRTHPSLHAAVRS